MSGLGSCITCGGDMPALLRNGRPRRFCNSRCSAQYGGIVASGIITPESAALSSKNHLRSLIRYGLRHDGLPGLAANDLLRLAGELGVAA